MWRHSMEENELIQGLTDAVVSGQKDKAIELSEKALEEGIDPYKAVIEGLAKGMEIMSEKYDKKEAFMPHLLMASNAMYGGMEKLTPHLKVDGADKPAVVVIGSVEGDVHDIGKNLVKTMMSAMGFDVVDLGKDVPIDDFVNATTQNKADIVSMSTLMTSTMDSMEKTVKALESSGTRDNIKLIVGGAPITESFAMDIGADTTKEDAMEAAKWAKSIVSELSPTEERWG